MMQILDSMIWNPNIIATHYTTDFPLFIDYLESSLVSDINARMFENKITLLDFNTWLEFCSVMIACRNCNTYAIKS